MSAYRYNLKPTLLARPPGQSRRDSALEAAVNVVVGYGLAFALNLIVLPAFGLDVTGGQAAGVAAVFTAASLARSYVLRRVFNWLMLR